MIYSFVFHRIWIPVKRGHEKNPLTIAMEQFEQTKNRRYEKPEKIDPLV